MQEQVRSNPIRMAAATWVVVLAVTFIAQKITGIGYDTVSESTGNLRSGVFIPLVPVAVILIAAITHMGIWKDVWVDKTRLKSRFTIAGIATILVGIVIVATLKGKDATLLPSSYLVTLVVSVLMVGFVEELLSRGILVTLFRQAKYSEVKVGLVSSFLFGISHFMNIFLGSQVGSVIFQVIFTAVIGYVLYLVRRSSGGLLLPILVHAGWDFAALLSTFYA